MLYTNFTRPLIAATLIASFLLTPAVARAQSCDPDTEARLQFLETRLEEGRPDALLWWRSWLAVYSIGVVYGVVSGVLEDNNEQADASYVTASKAVLGIADLTLRPHVARHGAAPIRAIPKTSAESCAERLRLAESTMEKASDAGGMRWSWKRHLSSLVLNIGAAVAIAEGADEPERGWRDFGISEASAEASIWTHPTRAVNDWQDYRTQFSGQPVAMAPASWHFAASPGGVGIVWKF